MSFLFHKLAKLNLLAAFLVALLWLGYGYAVGLPVETQFLGFDGRQGRFIFNAWIEIFLIQAVMLLPIIVRRASQRDGQLMLIGGGALMLIACVFQPWLLSNSGHSFPSFDHAVAAYFWSSHIVAGFSGPILLSSEPKPKAT